MGRKRQIGLGIAEIAIGLAIASPLDEFAAVVLSGGVSLPAALPQAGATGILGGILFVDGIRRLTK